MSKKSFSASLLFLVVVGTFLFLGPSEVHALSCRFPKSVFVASYQEGAFIDGFSVQYRGTGNVCDTRPIVDDNKNNAQNVFSLASQHLGQEISTGVYQLSTRCVEIRFKEIWDQYCKDTTLEQLTSNSAELARYKSEWKAKEQQSLHSVLIEKWTTALITIALVLVAILWPWITLRLKRNIKGVGSLFSLAIILQVILAFILFIFFTWSFELWQLIATISSLALLISVVVEIGYLIYRKIRMGKLNIS